MPGRIAILALFTICLSWIGTRICAEEPDLTASDTEFLHSAGIETDGPALVEYFRKRVVNDLDREHIGRLLRDLGDDDFDTREKASAALASIGAPARPQLQAALKDSDVEVSRRAAICLNLIDKTSSPPYLCAATRLLAHHKPDGATEVLLAYLPSAEDTGVADSVVDALKVVGFKDGKPRPALLAGLTDKHSLCRAGAADALWRSGDAEQREAVRKLLDDADVNVRLRLALALYDTKDKECVPALINLLTDAPRDQGWRVEEALFRIGGDKAPEGGLPHDDAGRQKYREQWLSWYKEHGKNLDLAKIEESERLHGFTLLTQMELTGTTGRVVELDATGKVRWEILGLRYPIDAQVLRGGDRVLVCEYTGRAVTERNLKGEVQWTKTVTGVLLGARRLPDGNTFITTRTQLLEVDKDGKAVTTINRNDVASAVKLRNGNIGVVTTLGKYVCLDKSGKELKSFTVGQIPTIGAHFEVLPNGHILVPQYSMGQVAEFDSEGKEIWKVAIQQPTCVHRLPNGNTLIGSRYARYLVEMDRNGKEVARITPEGRPTQIDRR